MDDIFSLAAPGADCLRSWRLATGRELPPVTRTVRLAQALRAELIRIALRETGRPVLPACLHGAPARADGIHRHAFWLPWDREGGGRLDHLTLFVPSGICPRARALLRRLSRLNLHGHGRLALVAGPTPGRIQGPSRIWHPASPFIAPRHGWKGRPSRIRAGHGPAAQLAQELARLRNISGAPGPGFRIRETAHRGTCAAGAYDLGRRAAKLPGHAGRGWFALEFDRPVQGPLALGGAAHFGMGLFLAADA